MAYDFSTFIRDVIIPSAVGAGSAFVIIQFLGKKLLNQLLEKEIIKYKSELEEKTVLLKTKLSIYAEEQNIANERIDSQKSIAIHEVYQMICKTMHPISRIIAGSPHVTDDNKTLVDFYFKQSELTHSNAQQLADTLFLNAIYFESDIYDEIARLSNMVMTVNAQLLRIMRRVPPHLLTSETVLNEIEEERSKFEQITDQQLRPMNINLLEKFRKKLGIQK